LPRKKLIAAEDLYDLQFVEDPQISPDGRHIAFVKLGLDKLGNQYRRSIWIVRPGDSKAKPRQFTFGAKSDTSPRWSPDSRRLAFVSARDGKPQIYLIGLDGGEARPLTAMPNGASNPVWSPDGQRLAFLSPVSREERRREDAGREELPPASALEAKHRKEWKEEEDRRKADPRVITRFPYRTGTEFLDDRFSHIYVMDVGDEPGKPYRLTEGEMNFDHISWTKDGRYLLSTQSRVPDYDPWGYHDVIRVPINGRRRSFRRLTRPGYEYFGPEMSPDGRWIAVCRMVETGSWGHTTHLAVMPAGGGAVRDLTLAFDRSVEAVRWSSDSRWLYFQAGDHGDTSLYRVGVRGGLVERVIGGRRMVLGFSVDRAGRLAFVAATPERPTDLYVAEAGGRPERRLSDFNDKLLAEREIARTEAVRFTAPDGYALQGWMLKPAGFRKGRKHPLVVSVHGGPHIMWGPSYPSMWIEWQFQAARGYVVFYCNPRGAEGYGEAHTDAIHNEWGELAMNDVLAGVDKVVGMGFVDSTRMALTGGSYAGYLTAWIVGHDRRFACAWAQRGLYNLLSWYGTSDIPQLIEREFDGFAFDQTEKIWQQSPLAYARDIHTPLAIEHQDQDYRCPVADAEQLYAALKRLKRTVVFYRYPREGHEMSRSGEPQHRVDRLKRMIAWFDRFCVKRRR
jgi:dipeptidyl aminopeptidase/acylaminoacyl peptidase